jgi:hypothetical protein
MGKVCLRSTMPATDCSTPKNLSWVAFRTIIFSFLSLSLILKYKLVVVVEGTIFCGQQLFSFFNQALETIETLCISTLEAVCEI